MQRRKRLAKKMETSKKPLDIRCTLCLLPVLIIALITEPVGLLFTCILLWIWSRDGKKGKRYNGTRKMDYTEDWFSDTAINKIHWSNSISFLSSSSTSDTSIDLI